MLPVIKHHTIILEPQPDGELMKVLRGCYDAHGAGFLREYKTVVYYPPGAIKEALYELRKALGKNHQRKLRGIRKERALTVNFC